MRAATQNRAQTDESNAVSPFPALQFPSTLEKGLNKLMSLKESFGGMVSQVRAAHAVLELWHST